MGRGSRCAGPEEEEEAEDKEGCSPVAGGRTSDFARLGRLTALLPHFDSSVGVDTGAGDRGGAPAEFAVVAETVGCPEDVSSVVLRYGGVEFEQHNRFSVVPTNLSLRASESLRFGESLDTHGVSRVGYLGEQGVYQSFDIMLFWFVTKRVLVPNQ